MTLDQLRYLAAVARTSHIGAAAKSLAVTPSAVSHALIGLSEELGIPIIIKVGRNIALSAQGQQLANRASAVLDQLRQMEDEIRSSECDLVGSLRISATAGTPSELTAKSLATLQRCHPRLSAVCASKRSALVIDDVLKSAVDLGLCYNPQPNPELVTEVITTERLLLAVRKDHPIFKIPVSKRIDFLRTCPSIMPMSAAGVESCQLHPALIDARITPSIVLQFDDYNTCCAYLQCSNAWSFIPESYLLKDGSGLKEALELSKPATAVICLVHLKARGINLIAREFASHLLQELSSERKQPSPRKMKNRNNVVLL